MVYQPGQQLGPYRLVRLLGRGGFAEVYLGEHIHLCTRAALKVLQVSLTEAYGQQFLTEARIIASLDHPHIVQVQDYGVEGGVPFLVMRYAPHGSIRAVHPPRTRVPLTTVVAYVNQIASALQYAHDHKLVHRDVKPENMLLGDRYQLLLSDFGLATIVHSSQQQNPQNVAGTASYMAPEQIQGFPCPASDQYALGIVVYEWLAGTLPFTGSHLEVVIQHLMASPPSLQAKVPDLVPAVEQVLNIALAKKPQERFTSVTAFAEALQQILQPKETSVLKQEVSLGLVSSAEQRRAAIRSRHRRLVGREEELAHLYQALLETEAYLHVTPAVTPAAYPWEMPARFPCLMLLGEAGIGKTRMAGEASRAAQQCGWTVIWVRGYAQEAGIPYRLWIDIVRMVYKQKLSSELERRPLQSRYQPLTMLVPELQAGLLAQTTSFSPFPQQEPLRLWEAFLAVLVSVSERAPLLLVLDDLQWTDGSSRDLLSYLCRHLVTRPVLMVGTCRESDLPSLHPLRAQIVQLGREQLLEAISLSALTDEQIAVLIEHLPAPSIRAIQQQVAGNPLFAEELACQYAQQGKEKRQNTLLSAKPQDTLLPSIVIAVLDQRLRSLSPACQDFLHTAAVLGRSFSLAIIHKLLTARITSLDEEQVLALIEEALQSGVLTEQEQGTDITYHFWHPLFTQYLYEALSVTRRTRIHRTVAVILQQLYAQQEIEGAAVILQHLLRGHGDSKQIVHYAELAGQHAHALASYPEAEQHYRTAFDHFDQHGGDWQQLAYLLEVLGECTRIQGKYEESHHFYTQALEVRSQRPMPTLPNEYQQESQIRALLWGEIGRTWFFRGNMQLAQQCYQSGERVLSDAGFVGGPAWAYLQNAQGQAKWRSGSYDDALFNAQNAVRLFEMFNYKKESLNHFQYDTHISRILMGDTSVMGHTHILLGLTFASRSQCNEALTHFNMALTLYEQHGLQREISVACGNLGDVHMRMAEYGQAQSFFQRALRIAEEIGSKAETCLGSGHLGVVATRLGNLSDAEQWLLESIKLAKRIDNPGYISFFRSYLTSVLYSRGKIVEARENVYLAVQLARSAKIAPFIGLSLVALGNIRVFNVLYDDVQKTTSEFDRKQLQRLERAKRTMLRAIRLKNIDTEYTLEGQLTLAYIELLLGNVDTALELSLKTKEEASQSAAVWLVAQSQKVLGEIFTAKGLYEESAKCFEEALGSYRKSEMRLEYARTAYYYGKALLARNDVERKGLEYLQEAHKIFNECGAMLDLQMVEKTLSGYQEVSQR